MKVLITGAKGQLGSCLQKIAGNFPEFEFIYTDREELDITDAVAVEKFVADNGLQACLNCAAYTAVDKAEEDQDLARKINVEGAANLASAMQKAGGLLVHISTDYVFDGRKNTPYLEEDSTGPLGVYGQTKLESEQVVIKNNPAAIVLRTAWLYSEFGKNIVKTFVSLGQQKPELGVIFDQTGSPTYAGDLAEAMLKILQSPNKPAGIYHFSNEGAVSWYDLAQAIMEIKQLPCQIKPIESSEYPFTVARPMYTVFNKKKIKQTFGLEIPYWRDSLEKCLAALE